MELTKEQALEEHRKMWNWIADQYEAGRTMDVHGLKFEYFECVEEKELKERPLHNCFCCEYAIQKGNRVNRCLNCPVIWGTEVYSKLPHCEHFSSAYQKLKNESCKFDKCDVDSEKCARLSREIANLPERKCV